MPVRTARGALLGMVLSCLLLLAGLVPTHEGAGSPRTASTSPPGAGGSSAAPQEASARSSTYQARMTAGRTTTVTGRHLMPHGASGVVLLAERVAPVADRTPPGPGDHQTVGPDVSRTTIPASPSGRTGWAVAVEVSLSQGTFPARAPPAV